MRKLMLLVCVLVFVAATVSAQLPSKPFNFYAVGGGSLAQSPDLFKSLFKTGYHVGAGLGFNYGPIPGMQVVGKAEYTNFGADMVLPAIFSGGAPDVKFLTYGIDIRYAIGAPLIPIKPFAFVGVGMANLSFSDVPAEILTFLEMPDEASKFYYNIGGGLEIMSNPAFSFFLQGRFVSVSIDGGSWQYIPVSLGIRF